MKQTDAKPSGILFRTWRIFPWIEFHPGETTLAWGLFFVAITAALFHFVMFGLLAPAPALIAILLLVRGLGATRAPGRVTARQCLGAALLMVGLLILAYVAFTAASFSTELALANRGNTKALTNLSTIASGILATFAIASIIQATLLPKGFSLWTNWPPSRRRKWTALFLAFPLITILIHLILAALGGPLSA